MRWMLALAVALTVVPAASARLPNACTLLTRAQAEAALGAKLQWSQRQGNKLSSTCTFHGEPYNASAYAQPTLTLVVNRITPARFRQAFRVSATAFRVRGVGDDAYATGGIVRTLNVLGNGYGLMVMIPQEKTLQWAKRLAGEALTHLKT
jgi:hypothetical protein